MTSLEFGFIPRRVIDDLHDIGNWRVRADAIESLKTHVGEALRSGQGAFLSGPSLSGLTDFLLRLLEDPNFKISLTSMQILADVVKRAGGSFLPHVDGVVPRLALKLGDNKIVVRHAVLKVLSVLCVEVGPVYMASRLLPALDDRNPRVRGAVLGALCLTLGSDPEAFKFGEGLDLAERIVRRSIASYPALAPASPEDEGLAQGAGEVLAAAAKSIGTGRTLALLHASSCPEEARAQLGARVRSGDPPTAPNEDGIIDFFGRMGSAHDRDRERADRSSAAPDDFPGPAPPAASTSALPNAASANGRRSNHPAAPAGRRRPVRTNYSAGYTHPDDEDLGYGSGASLSQTSSVASQLTSTAVESASQGGGSGSGRSRENPAYPSADPAVQSTLSDIRKRLAENNSASLGSANRSAPQGTDNALGPRLQVATSQGSFSQPLTDRRSPDVAHFFPSPSPPPLNPFTECGDSVQRSGLSWNVPSRPVAAEPPSFSASRNGPVMPPAPPAGGMPHPPVWHHQDRLSHEVLPSQSRHHSPLHLDTGSMKHGHDLEGETPKFGGLTWSVSRNLPVGPPDTSAPDSLALGLDAPLQHRAQAGRRAHAIGPSEGPAHTNSSGNLTASISALNGAPGPREPTFDQALFNEALMDRRASPAPSASASSKSIDLAPPSTRTPNPPQLDLKFVGGGATTTSPQQIHAPQPRPGKIADGRRGLTPPIGQGPFGSSYGTTYDFGPLTEPARRTSNQPAEDDSDDADPSSLDRPASRNLSTTLKLSLLKQRAHDRRSRATPSGVPGQGDLGPVPHSAGSFTGGGIVRSDDGFGVELSAASAPFLRSHRAPSAEVDPAGGNPRLRGQAHRVQPIPEHPFGMDEHRLSGVPQVDLPMDARPASQQVAQPPVTPRAASSVSSALQRLRNNKASRGQPTGDLGPVHYVPPTSPLGSQPDSTRSRAPLSSRGNMGSAASTFSGTMNFNRTERGTAEDRSTPKEFTRDELLPLSSSDRAMRSVLQELVSANTAGRKEVDWVAQYEALVTARRLAAHHTPVVHRDLHALCVALAPAIDALRSLTAKTAMILVEELALALGRQLDSELDGLIPVLLKRAGEQSIAGRENFLCQMADQALMCISDSCGESKTASTLLASMGHKNGAVRSKVALHMDYLLDRRGASFIGGGRGQDALEKILSSAAALLDEGSLETRTYAKRILWSLRRLAGGEDAFERCIRRLTDVKAKQVRGVFDGQAGPPQPPRRPMSRAPVNGISTPSSAASNWEGGLGSTRAASRHDNVFGRTISNNSNPNGEDNSTTFSRTASFNRTAGGGLGSGGGSRRNMNANDGLGSDPAVAAALAQANGSKDWASRLEAINEISELLRDRPAIAPEDGAAIAECLSSKSGDGNAKVQLQSLATLKARCPILRDAIASTVHVVVPPLAAALASSNEKVRVAAGEAMDAIVETVEPLQLLQVIAHSASHAKGPARASLYDRMVTVARACHPKKPNLVQRFAVPSVVAGLQDPKPEVRQAVAGAVRALYELYGDGLFEFPEIPQASRGKMAELARGY